jgi:hypothetical protein
LKSNQQGCQSATEEREDNARHDILSVITAGSVSILVERICESSSTYSATDNIPSHAVICVVVMR